LRPDLNPQDLLAAASLRWARNLVRLRPDLVLAGSPERTAWRSVVETEDGRLFVLEKIPFFPVHDRLPTGFCHGDFHPLNIIWGNTEIRAVIDWEFCGTKPETYDLANLLGCLGMEDPQSLDGPFAGQLIQRLRKAGIFSDTSWQALPDLMLAIRFAWLSEWLRKNDRPMIRLEADYMALLLDIRSFLI
jgi:Ser/Thr protein kinase RdoA (MazF antagonist)